MKRSDSRLSVQPANGDKIFKIDDHIYVMVSGMAADAQRLIDEMRIKGQDHTYVYDSPMPIEQLVEKVGSMKQYFTQQGGMRPYGAGFIFVGWDEYHGF